MRKSLATPIITSLVSIISLVVSTSPTHGQGLLRRLQDRVQSLDQQNAGDQDSAATGSGGSVPRAGGQRTNPRRPLVDALLQYGPEIFGNAGSDAPASVESGVASGRPAVGGNPVSGVANFEKATLGIDVLESPPGVPGVLVTGFRSDSRADDAGLQKNDVIVSLDQTLTPKIADIAKFLSQRRPGESVSARVLRGNQMKTIRIPLLGASPVNAEAQQRIGAPVPIRPIPQPPEPGALLPSPPDPGRSALGQFPADGQVESLPAPMSGSATQLSAKAGAEQYGILLGSESTLRGAVIEGVVTGSAANLAGLKPADRVVSVNRLLTHNNTALVRQLENLPEGTLASLGVVRGDAYFIKGMTLTTEISPSGPAVEEQLNAASNQHGSDEKGMAAETGVLEGLGSVLGGLLGGGSKKNGQPRVEAIPQSRKDAPDAKEPVKQTGFEQKVSGQLEKMLGDPPSLNGLPVKSKSATATNPEDAGKQEPTAEEMREQIRQLQEKLKQMEKRSSADGKAVKQD